MNKTKIIIIALLLTGLFIMLSCDRRSNINGPVASYSVDVYAFESATVPKNAVRVGCFITDLGDLQVGNILVHFETVESGYISPTRTSSESDQEDGLSGADLYFDPDGVVGDVHIVAYIDYEGTEFKSDTTLIHVYPYLLTLSADDINLLIAPTDTTYINCVVQHPVTLQDVADVHLLFSADFGYITPSAMSSDNSLNGMQSEVKYIAPDNSGIATITVIAVYPYPELIMGTDTLQITVSG